MAQWYFDGAKWMPITGGIPVPESTGSTDYAGDISGAEGDDHARYIRGPHKGQFSYGTELEPYKTWYEEYKAAHPSWPVPIYGGTE